MDIQKSYCVKCLKEVSEDVKECDCGCTTFAYGDLNVEGGKILCKCGNHSFRSSGHFDYTNKAVTTMNCEKCGNPCGTEHYRDAEEMAYWEDDSEG